MSGPWAQAPLPSAPPFAGEPARSAAEPRWGLGDVGISLLFWLGTQVAVAFAIVIPQVLSGEVETAEDVVSDPSLGMLTAMVVANWFGLMLWPVIASFTKGRRDIRADFGLGFGKADLGAGIVGGVVLFGIGMVANLAWILVTDSDPPDNSGFVEPTATSVLAVVVLVLVVAVGTPIVEELYFRGFLLRALGKRWGLPVGVVASSAIFGLFHFQGEGLADLWIMGMLTLYGYVLAILTVRARGRLGAAIVAHAINNGVAVATIVLTSST